MYFVEPKKRYVHQNNKARQISEKIKMSNSNDKPLYQMLILLEHSVDEASSSSKSAETNAKKENTAEATTENTPASDATQENEAAGSIKQHEYVDEISVPVCVGEEHMEELNSWFDKFDEKICIPNEGYIKYEITSDGLIVLLIDESRASLVDEVTQFAKA